MKVKTKREYVRRRHMRLRQKISGTAECPRMSVKISSRHIYAQVIDDMTGCTLASASSMSKDLRALTKKKKTEIAREVGKLVAEAANKAGVERVVFDRGGYAYGGRIKALADAAREAGLKF